MFVCVVRKTHIYLMPQSLNGTSQTKCSFIGIFTPLTERLSVTPQASSRDSNVLKEVKE